MSDTIKNHESKETTFWALIEKYCIIIPIIQRDYAQGRDDSKTKTIRDKFLSSLYDALVKPNGNVVLDYVYGSIKPSKGDHGKDCFSPIDGQQRLTTLFLLHRYFSWKEKDKDDLGGINELLSHFYYEVRDTANEFCKLLSDSPMIMDENVKSLSDSIRNANWYHASYDSDPTVKAMLVMLDAIHKRFADVKDGWKRLTTEKAVTFWQLPMENFSLDDDLYVKMNSRGRRLSPFDNFKNYFEQQLDREKERFGDLVDRWKFSIDNDWADFFYRKLREDKTEGFSLKNDMGEVENALYRFILLFLVSESLKQGNDRILYDDRIQIVSNQQELADTKYFNVESLVETFLKGENNLGRLLNALDVLLWLDRHDWGMETVWKNGLRRFVLGKAVFRNFVYLYSLMRFLGGFYDAEKDILEMEKDDLDEFVRLRDNLIVAERSLLSSKQIYLPHYILRIQEKTIGRILKGFDCLIDEIGSPNNILHCLQKIPPGTLAGLPHEITKTALITKGMDVRSLEMKYELQGQIYNFLDDDGQSFILTANEFDELWTCCPKDDLLRGLYCFYEDDAYGLWTQCGSCRPGAAYYRRYYCGFNSVKSDLEQEEGVPCGDLIWTSRDRTKSGNESIQKQSMAVKSFLRAYKAAKTSDRLPKEAIDAIIADTWKGNAPDKNKHAYYFIKYPAFLRLEGDNQGCIFFREERHFSFLRLLRFEADNSFTFKNFDEAKHYNPFYLALKERLDALRSKGESFPAVKSQLIFKGQPGSPWIKLDNGIGLCLNKNGDWTVKRPGESENTPSFQNQDRIEDLLRYIR